MEPGLCTTLPDKCRTGGWLTGTMLKDGGAHVVSKTTYSASHGCLIDLTMRTGRTHCADPRTPRPSRKRGRGSVGSKPDGVEEIDMTH